MKKKENKWLETLTEQDTILIKKSFLLSLIPKIEDKTIQRVALNILKEVELQEETKKQSEIEISISVLKIFVSDISSIPTYACSPSADYYKKIYNEMTYEERMRYKDGVETKTCTNCVQSKCPFYHSSTNQIDCYKWHNPYLIGKQYVLKKTK